jgi:O-antigen/teichoic acid export membrane protein
VFCQAALVVQGVVLARLLGPEGRGQLAAILLWPGLLAVLGVWGVDLALGRRAARPADVAAVVRSALVLAPVTAALAAAVGALVLPRLVPRADPALLPLALVYLAVVLPAHLRIVLERIDLGRGDFVRMNLGRAMLAPLTVAALAALAAAGRVSLLGAVLAYLAAEGAVAAVRVYWATRGRTLRGPLLPMGPVARDAASFGLATGLDALVGRMDVALAVYVLSAGDVGLYVVAMAAARTLSIVGTSAGLVGFARSAGSAPGGGFAEVARMVRRLALVKLAGGAALAAAVPVLVPAVFGEAFAGAVPAALVLIAAYALAGLAAYLDQCLRGQGRPLVGVGARLAGLAVFVPLGWWGAGRWGLAGTAAAFAAAQAVTLGVLAERALAHWPGGRAADLLPRWSDVRGLTRTKLLANVE